MQATQPATEEISIYNEEAHSTATSLPPTEEIPQVSPSALPSETPFNTPTNQSSETPVAPTPTPSAIPTLQSTATPSNVPSLESTITPSETPQTESTSGNAPATLLVVQGAKIIPDRYIVVLKNESNPLSASSFATNAVSALGGKITTVYTAALKGYAAYLPPEALKKIRSDPSVDYIEADQIIKVSDDNFISKSSDQSYPSWGLDRIDQHNLPLNNNYTYLSTAFNVNVYVIDTGIHASHAEFSGRATKDYDAIGDGMLGEDCNGHGTHVAGIVGGKTYGVAKSVRLHGVRVLDCSGQGSVSGVIAGVDWVTSSHLHPAVANMSLGGGASDALDNAIQNSINHGITYIVAGGNENSNACNYSPARLPAAITVGSTTSIDARSYFSNYGTCLDIFAPGSNITSAWIYSNTSTTILSGTSMASPHVAGAAALYLSTNTTASPATVTSALINYATVNKITDPGSGSPNRLVYAIFPPSAPALRYPASTAYTGSPTFSWATSNSATLYALYIYTSSNVVKFASQVTPTCSSTACFYTPSALKLTPGTYKWAVRAGNIYAWSSYSTWLNFSTSIPTLPNPQYPASTAYTGNPTFNWTKPTGGTLYGLYVYTTSNIAKLAAQITPTCGTSNCTYTPSSLNLPVGTYKWAVRAGNTVGWTNYSTWLNFSVSAPPAPTPRYPASTAYTKNPTFSWTKPISATSYMLYVYTASNVAKFTGRISATCNTTTCFYTPTALNLSAGNYKWAIRAGNTVGWSNYSTWLNFSTSVPAVPAPQTPASKVFTGNPTFTWTQPTGATLYALYVYTTSNVAKFTGQVIPTCNGTTCSYTPKTLNLPIGSYKWVVRAGNTVGWSSYSTWLYFSR